MSSHRPSDFGPLLFVPGANPNASFVALDRDLLSGRGLEELAPGTGAAARIAFAAKLASALTRTQAPLVILWFAAPGYGSIVAALCRLARVPFLVLAGGAEVASCDAAEFGDARSPLRRMLVRRVLSEARLVWAFSAAARHEIGAIAPAARVRVVPPAVDTHFYRPVARERRAQALTVCSAITRVTMRQKGLDRVVALARARPDVPFLVTGRVEQDVAAVQAFVAAAPPNLRFTGFVTREALRDFYAASRVYLQLSVHEGFGVAVVEAMAMGCTPLVTDLASLREVVTEPALRLADGAPLDVQLERLDRALSGSYAAESWAELDARFGIEARRAAWLAALDELSVPLCADSRPS
jgi:glycosyltransferase involved in cell wall biosynthesis